MIIQLSPGDIITPKREINPTMVSNWRYAAECGKIYGILPGARLKVVEVNKIPGRMWVRVGVAYDPPVFLKIAGEEFTLNFRLLDRR